MGFFFKKANKTNRCLLCGSEVAAGKCTACGREAKPLVPLSTLNWQKVPLSVGEALGEQKKKLFGNALLTVKEMIANGELYIADIHIDGVYEHECDSTPDEDDYRTEYDYYIQFSTPDLAPCDTDCEVSEGDYDRAEALLKSGRHDAYYVFVPRNSDAAAMLTKGLFEKFIGFGECTEKRKLPY